MFAAAGAEREQLVLIQKQINFQLNPENLVTNVS